MTKLDEIVAWKKEELALRKRERPPAQLEQALKTRPPTRSFREAIARPGRVNLIAEIKKVSTAGERILPGTDVL